MSSSNALVPLLLDTGLPQSSVQAEMLGTMLQQMLPGVDLARLDPNTLLRLSRRAIYHAGMMAGMREAGRAVVAKIAADPGRDYYRVRAQVRAAQEETRGILWWKKDYLVDPFLIEVQIEVEAR